MLTDFPFSLISFPSISFSCGFSNLISIPLFFSSHNWVLLGDLRPWIEDSRVRVLDVGTGELTSSLIIRCIEISRSLDLCAESSFDFISEFGI